MVGPLILASASPRRAELLTSAGFRFTVEPADVDESEHPGESPEAYVLRVAGDKARTIAARRQPHDEAAILAADTTVVAAGQLLAKPVDEADAVRMLTVLAGTIHDVFTGVVVLKAGREAAEVVRTRVRMTMTPAEIEWYVASGEAMGKAGAYGIQGRAARFIDWIDGSWSNVVGLPVATVDRLLKELGA